MTLVKCPDCGKMVSDLAPLCIGCGRPLDAIPKPQPLPVQKENVAQQSNVQRRNALSESQEIIRHTKKNLFFIVVWVLLLCLGGYFLWESYSFLSVAEPAVARVLSTSHPFRSRRGGTKYKIEYVFNVNGHNYRGTDTVHTPPSSDFITIFYNRNNPEESKAHKPDTTTGWVLVGLGLFAFAMFSGVLKYFRD